MLKDVHSKCRYGMREPKEKNPSIFNKSQWQTVQSNHSFKNLENISYPRSCLVESLIVSFTLKSKSSKSKSFMASIHLF